MQSSLKKTYIPLAILMFVLVVVALLGSGAIYWWMPPIVQSDAKDMEARILPVPPTDGVNFDFYPDIGPRFEAGLSFKKNLALGKQALYAGNSTTAGQFLERAAEQRPASGEARGWLGIARIRAHQWEQGKADIEQAQATGFDHAELHRAQADYFIHAALDLEGARNELLQAIKLDPEGIEAYLDIAETYDEQGYYNLALSWAREGQKKKESARGWSILAKIQVEQENYKDAIKSAEMAVALEPAWCGAHLARAYVLLKSGKFDEALPVVEEAIRLTPRPIINNRGACAVKSYMMKGAILESMGRAERAAQSYYRAVNPPADSLYWQSYQNRTREHLASILDDRRCRGISCVWSKMLTIFIQAYK